MLEPKCVESNAEVHRGPHFLESIRYLFEACTIDSSVAYIFSGAPASQIPHKFPINKMFIEEIVRPLLV